MTPDEYQKAALRTEFTPEMILDRRQMRLLHAAIGVCSEAGELHDAIKREFIYGKEFDPTNIMEECSDILWYVALALDAVGYTMADCMERNINKLRVRYPEKFSVEGALNRDAKKEREALEEK